MKDDDKQDDEEREGRVLNFMLVLFCVMSVLLAALIIALLAA